MDEKKGAEGQGSAREAQKPAPGASAPSGSQFDDFGLPIRQYQSPEPDASPVESISKPEHPVKEPVTRTATAPTPKGDAVADQRGAASLKPAKELEDTDDRPGSGSESEAGEFADAQSEITLADPAPEPDVATPRAPQGPLGGPKASAAPVEPSAQAETADSKTADNAPANESKPLEEAKTPAAQGISHTRDASKASTVNGLGISEFSHQQLPEQAESEDGNGEDEWQTMPAYARYDMYDDDDRLVAREHDPEEDETLGYGSLGGAGKGYTRVTMDDDAQSATSMDDNTKYLFKEVNSTSLTGADEDEARDAVSQMQATKDLLTEGQRIAYVGIVRLEIAGMLKEGEAITLTKKTKKATIMAIESLRMWGQKMMIRLYAHMDISEAEQVMIEQLADHGVIPADLTPALLANARVSNPMAEEEMSQRGSVEKHDEIEEQGSPTAEPEHAERNAEDSAEASKAEKSKAEETKEEASDSQLTPPPYPEEKVAEPPPPYEKESQEEVPGVQTPSQMPTTDQIDIDLRWTVLCDIFLVLIADSIYDARSRVLLERVGKSLSVDWWDICRFEKRVTDALEMQQAAEKENWNEEEHMENRRKLALRKRYVMMGLATVGGGLVIGLSAGLLAPVIGAGLAAGFTTIGVSGTGTFLAGAGGAAVISSTAATTGGIIGGRAANRRTGAVKTFEYRPLHNNKRVNLIVTVSGWLTGKVDDVRLPFSTVDPIMGDLYSVLWEPEMLTSMGDTINILANEALTQGLQHILGSTFLITLMAGLQLPIVLTKLSYLIDNPWAVSLDRAVSAGQILADSLIERNLGTRPITLVGYSLGARVIFSCLQELAKRGAVGLVQNAYMFGSPVVVKTDEFLRARTVVAGRFVNGYNRNDWILGYLFRLTNGGIRRVAGLAAIDGVPGLENMDVTDEVIGHMEYRTVMPSLLMKCGWMVESEEFSEIEDPDPDNHQARQRELINEIEEARKNLDKEGKESKSKSKFGFFSRRKKGERQEWEVYEDSAKKDGVNGRPGPGGDPNHASSNSGVLFDVDAIRAELAKEAENGMTEELQIKEIQSTLPPMKLDLNLSPPPHSAGATPVQASPGVNALPKSTSANSLPAAPGTLANGAGRSFSSATYGAHDGGEGWDDSEVSMTFDTSFNDPQPSGSSAGTPSRATQDTSSTTRPEYRTSQTAPTMNMAAPWGESDDEEFGKEKEISMTFA